MRQVQDLGQDQGLDVQGQGLHKVSSKRLTGYEVIVIYPLGGASGDFS